MKIVTLGEIMLRLSTVDQQRFAQSQNLTVVFGGGEANVAVSLANYGHDAYFVSKIVDNEIGDACIKSLLKNGVKTDYIARGGNRLGIYFLEPGASLRPSKVIYDRANSSIAEAKITDFDFAKIFDNALWFHFSGITPALSNGCTIITENALIEAKKQGVTVSVDLNYRKKLWTSEEAIKIMRPLMKYVDVCIGNEEDVQKVLGLKNTSNVITGHLEMTAYEQMFLELKKEFDFKVIATTLRESHSANHNTWSAIMYINNTFYYSKKYEINPIIDRIGAGDSFSGGLINGLIKYPDDPQKALEFAVAASALKHTIPGDFNLVSESEVLNLVSGDGSGRVQR